MDDSKQKKADNVPKQRRKRFGILGGTNKSGDFNRYLFLAKTHDVFCKPFLAFGIYIMQ